jgi:rod shape-determining protein MreC
MRALSRRQRLSALLLALVALAFITLDVAGGNLRGAHAGARGVLGGLYRGTDAVVGPARRFVQGVPDVSSNRQKISALEQQNSQLRKELATNSVDAATRDRLQKLQLTADADGYRIVPARVIAYGPGEGFEWTATIDTGSGSGIAVDQTVTDGVGLVGRVLHVGASTAVILLAADPGSGVGVSDLRTGQLGVATGQGTSGFSLSPLDPAAQLEVGDQLQTGPAGQSTYAAGLMVGTVASVRVADDGTTSATVTAATSPTGLNVVGVIVAGARTASTRAALTPSPSAQR